MLQEVTRQISAMDVPAPTDQTSESDSIAEFAAQYKNILGRIDSFRRKEQDLLIQFTDENIRVKEVRTQLAGAESIKRKFELDHPTLFRPMSALAPRTNSSAPQLDRATESARLIASQSKIAALKAQLEELRTEAIGLDALEVAVSDLRRRKELEEANYRYYAATAEQARINEALSSGRVSNISVIQKPSPLSVDSRKSDKTIMSIGVAGIAIGLGWALFVEYYMDRTVRRPKDIERRLRLPLFLSIPDFGRKHRLRLQVNIKSPPRLLGDIKHIAPAESIEKRELSDWESIPGLHPFHETLRDRLIGYFESKNLTHKPKLVAVTGLARGAGVTTVAAGLAGSLSETGDGNVLLVDLTPGQGSAQQFYRGKAVCGLEEILAARNNAQIQENLFVVGGDASSDKLSRLLPQRFTKLVPLLKASNFDYIIFDMPPVSQISLTPRLAGFMDMVLLVIESEKTDQHLVEGAATLLRDSNAHVGAVLNKARNYVPLRLHQDSLGNI